MSKCLLEQLPGIFAAGKRQAAHILEQLEGRNRVSLQTRELVIPSKDHAGFSFWGNDSEGVVDQPSRLIYGDNLLAMAALLAGDEDNPSLRGKIDLIYIDPPFDSKADYRTKITLPGTTIDQKPTVFEQFAYSDTWSEGTASYLAMITPRLVLMRELMTDTASIYVHLDWHVGHYVKLVMDEIFGRENLVNEVIWRYGKMSNATRRYPQNHDTIFCYGKTSDYFFRPVRSADSEYKARFSRWVVNNKVTYGAVAHSDDKLIKLRVRKGRGDPSIDELKADTRDRISKGLEPTNYFDVLFIVKHPAFSDFYDELLSRGLMVETGEDADNTGATGDLEHVDLRPGYQAYDFEIPIILRDADEELRQPSIDPLALASSPYPLDMILKAIGTGDRFVSHDAQTGTQYGDYRVDGGVLTATGYNDYLSRMTTRITEALGRTMTKSQSKYNENAKFPILQAYRPLLAGWLDTYVRHRLFAQDFDPLDGENWRALLLDDVAHSIAGTFATKLVELQESHVVASAEVQHRFLSEVTTIPLRGSTAEDVVKCIYPKLPIPSQGGGLERRFIRWADKDSGIEALAKVHEYRHDFLCRPYLKADGMPAQYSPDFLVRTSDTVFVVETKAQSAQSDENVQRKKKAALAWCEQINELPEEDRDSRRWDYVLLGETVIVEWEKKNASVTDLLDYARLRRVSTAKQERLL